MKRYRNIIISLTLLMFVMSGPVFAKPVNKMEAEKAVMGWLKADAKPLDMTLGGQIKKVDAYNGTDGQPVYYIVYLKPSGFVIVPADDAVEPIIGFVAGDTYDPSPQNCLRALIERDMPARVASARKIEQEISAVGKDKLTGKDKAIHEASVKAKNKWSKLKAYTNGELLPTGPDNISDVRVATLMESRWDQGDACGSYCYNYYTPNHYVCGCVATAMAQVVRYFTHQPAGGIGVHPFTITVNGTPQTAYTRGGDGSGGLYDWNLMVLQPEPACGITTAQRQAIGALCYDCGVTVEMGYSEGGSGAYMHHIARALKDIYGYTNTVYVYHDWYSSDSDLLGMVNPNLDAGYPVLFSIWDQADASHAIVCDGYGYNATTLYHHLNIGWGGYDDAWYNLPYIDAGGYDFSVIDSVTYNVYTSGTGEIISGRVTDNNSGVPISGATVTASGPGGPYSTTTNAKGIYAFAKVGSNSTYTIHVDAAGHTFDDQVVTTGRSVNDGVVSGNKWGIDFGQGGIPPTPEISVEFQAGTAAGWSFYNPVGNINRDSQVDFNDLSIMAQYWLDGSCSDANQWCARADIDESNDVTCVDYALLANDWAKQAGESVLLQTIYGTAQDSTGNITANNYRALSQDKGMAMAFKVDADTVLDKGTFKCFGEPTRAEDIRIRLYNVTGKNYLLYSGHPTVSKADPGSGGTLLFDITATRPNPTPVHSELGDGRSYFDTVINFDSLQVTAGEYFIVFDAMGPSNTWGSMVKGTGTAPALMGQYPDGVPLPKRATVTTSSSEGNTYYYYLSATSSTSYKVASDLFVFQILTKPANQTPQVNAGADQRQ